MIGNYIANYILNVRLNIAKNYICLTSNCSTHKCIFGRAPEIVPLGNVGLAVRPC